MPKKANVVPAMTKSMEDLLIRIKDLTLDEINRGLAYSRDEISQIEREAEKLHALAEQMMQNYTTAQMLLGLLEKEKEARTAN